MPGTGKAAQGLRCVVRLRFVSFVVCCAGTAHAASETPCLPALFMPFAATPKASAEGRV